MKLKQYQKYLKAALYLRQDCSYELAVPKPALELYQNFINNHYQYILQKMFPRFGEWMDIPWEDLASEYYLQFPPTAHDLNDLTKNFPTFLKAKADAKQLPDFIPELAQYELAEFMVYKHKGHAPIPSNNCLQINPAHELLIFKYDIPTWIVQWEEQSLENFKAPVQQATYLIIARSPQKNLCIFTNMTTIDLLIYEFLKENQLNLPALATNINQFLDGSMLLSIDDLETRVNFLRQQALII